jgi:hypothetical protein
MTKKYEPKRDWLLQCQRGFKPRRFLYKFFEFYTPLSILRHKRDNFASLIKKKIKYQTGFVVLHSKIWVL